VIVYGLDYLRPRKFIQKINDFIIKQADHVIVISEATRMLLKRSGILDDKISIIHPAIDPENYKVGMNSYDVRNDLRLEDKVILLTVGRLVVRKGHMMVINALPKIVEAIPNVHYIIVGDGPEKENLLFAAEKLNVSDYISFVGFVPDGMLSSYYQYCDIFVTVSQKNDVDMDMEGFGIVFLEANLHSKPVIGTKVGGIIEAVVQNETGILIDPGDIDALVEGVILLTENKDLAREYGERGRDRVLNELTSEITAKKFLDVLNGNTE
jgi:phosphatidylinositol alpha-1,6-mannosyltransferase